MGGKISDFVKDLAIFKPMLAERFIIFHNRIPHDYSDDLPPHLVRLQNRKSKALKGVDFFDVFRDTVPEVVMKLPELRNSISYPVALLDGINIAESFRGIIIV